MTTSRGGAAVLCAFAGNLLRKTTIPGLPMQRTQSSRSVQSRVEFSGWMFSNITRLIWILALLFAWTAAANSQQQESHSQKQFWPELNAYVPVAEKMRLFFLFTTTETETKEKVDGQVGVHLDYTVNKRLVLRAGYRSLDDSDPFTEHRPIMEPAAPYSCRRSGSRDSLLMELPLERDLGLSPALP